MYESPIELIRTQMNMALDNEILKAVQNVGINVDKEELTQALTQDRKRYEYAYDQGWNDCKKHYEEKLKKISETIMEED